MTNISQSFFISRVHQLRTGLKYLVPRAAAGQLSHPRRRGGLTVSPCSLIMSSSITKNESAPRTELNLCVVDLNPFTGRRLGPARRLTHWTDFQIYDLSASVDGHRVSLSEAGYRQMHASGKCRPTEHASRLCANSQTKRRIAYLGIGPALVERSFCFPTGTGVLKSISPGDSRGRLYQRHSLQHETGRSMRP
jgi:hypothetical protein